jgi:signal transduction histidine kinase/ligand-binding sensor domain-containing protein
MKGKLILLFSFVLFSISAACNGLRFTNLGVLQGLSSAGVNVVYTDSRGFSWIGTGTGLNRFDGETFTVFDHRRNDSTSIPGDNVESIAEDSSGMLWIGTDMGIAKFNPWNGKAETIRQIFPVNQGKFPCTNIIVDSDQNIWANSIAAVWKYNRKKNILEYILNCDGKENRPERCYSIFQDSKKRFWICGHDGLSKYNPQTGSLEIFELFPGYKKQNFIVRVFETHSGQLWCATWGHGFAKFFPDEKKFSWKQWEENPENPSATNLVFGYAETFSENHYKLWAATNYGLALLSDSGSSDLFSYRFLRNDPANPESILSNQVNCISGNKFGQLFAGTAGGLSVLLPERQFFKDYSSGFSGQTMHIQPDKNSGNFFCTWYGNGIQQIDKNGMVIRTWKKIPENKDDVDCGQISDVISSKDGSLWVATFGGLCHSDPEKKNFKQILPDSGNPNSICDKHIICLAEDHEGKIWCGSYGKGISVLNPADNSCVNYSETGKNAHGLQNNLIWSICCTKSGEIWLGTNNGIAHYNRTKNEFETRTYILRGKDTLNLGVCFVYEDRAGMLWFCTDNGLFFRKQDNTFGSLLKEDGLIDNHIHGVHDDADGNIWIATLTGLSRYVLRTGTFTNYSLGSVLPVTSLDGDFGSTADGKLLFGLNSRIISFDPAALPKPDTAIVFLTGISVSGKVFSFEKNPSLISESEFPWNDNVISFDFVSPGLHGDPNVKYEYRMIGADKDWIVSGSRHYASYVGLPPGTYSFESRASLNNGEWSAPAGFSFVIHPPFWKTWWFIISIILITLTLTILIVRREVTLKIRRQILILEKQQAVEKERNRISRDMHDDLGSGLTKIAILSEVAKKKIRKDDASIPQIDIISESSRELVDNLNEIIWALNPDNDNLSNLTAYIREYADRYLESFDISLRCEIPEQLPQLHLSEEKRRNIFLIVKEALHNIVKHADPKTVEIIFGTENGNLFVEVTDDGKGFDQSTARPLGNGLKSMQKRAIAIGATLEMKSKQGEGSSVKLILSGEKTA